jgi:lipoprotein-anchoring transpeptidase ErfK/SrfK
MLGSKGPAVATLQQKLIDLTYQPGRTDGVFDTETRQAVIAFQKVEGLQRDGVVGPRTWSRLLTAQSPSPRLTVLGTRVEIDLTRQVLFFIEDNRIVKTLAVSTGKPGWVTPPGHFSVLRKIPAWHRSPLGLLYKPAFVVGGIAIHGSYSVPTYPASHGCIRVTVAEMDILYPQLPLRLEVDVYY